MSKLLLLALACLFVSTQALSLTQVPIGTTPWSVSHVKTTYTYGAQDDITVFTYSVTAGSGADALSHFVIGVSPAPASATLISDDISSDFQDYTSIADPATGLKGYLYPLGSESATTTFNLKFKGKVNWKAGGTYGVKGHQLKYSVVPNSIVVPDFEGGDDWVAGNAPLSVPADVEVPCSNTAATAKPAAALVQQVDTTGSHCPAEKVLLNVYERELDAGNKIYSRQIQRVSVKDNTPPEFIEPANFTSYIQLTCTDAIPPLPGVTAQDDCDSTPILQPPCAEQRANGTCPTNYFLRRTWTATDHCGNSKCKTQTIAVIDNKAPILIGVPNNTVIECNPSVPVADPPTVTASDECNCFTYPPNSNNPVSYTQETRPGECNNTMDIIRTWSATDCCGNHVSANQIIVIEDTTPPFINFTTPNSSGTFECDSVPAFPTAYAYDICMLYLPTIYVNQTITNSTRCPKQDYTITRVYYTIDDCGNYNSTTSVYDVLDRTPPQWNISSLPLNETRECGHVPEPENPTATDNCGKHDVIRLPDTRENSSCPNEYIIYRHWTVIDDCGNYNNYTQQVTVVDTTPTYIDPSSVPQFGPYECASEVPALDRASDINGLLPQPCGPNQDCNCDTSFIKNFTESRVNGTCVNKFNVTRYYTFTDCSGNNDTKPSTFTVSDIKAPVLTGPPNTTNECSAINPIGTPTSNDNCDGTTLPIYYSNYNITGACAGNFTVVRIWNVTDVCSNQATHTQFITVQDTKAPVYSYVPGPISAVCSPPAKERLNASDLCSGVTVYNDLPSVESNRKCRSNYTLTHYWAAKDGCGHWNNVSQPVTVYDNVPPTLSGVPQDQNVSCDAIPIPASVCAVDNCIGVNITFTEVKTTYACNADGFYYTLTRTWTATDDCGNTASASQRVNVFNRYTPQFFPATQANLNQVCESVVLPDAPTANNSCSAATVTPYHFRVNGSCPDSYVLHRNFRALDSPCQNANWLNYTITVTDTKAPNFTFVPAAVTVQCTPPNPGSPTASDKCDATPTIGAARDTIISYTCPHIYVVNRTWNATDDCGNFAFAYQIINVTNPNFPVWGVSMPANITGLQSCVAPEPPTVNATASCGERVNITYTQIRINGSCEYNYTLIRKWVAVDECFHTISHTQSITLFDAVPPTVSPVTSYIESYCSAPAIPDVCVTDNCNGVRLQFNETEPQRRCNNNRTLVRVWVGIDECGNKNSVQQIVVINDTVAPVFDPVTPPNDYSVNCSLPTLTNPTATDACGGQVDLKDFSWRENGTCPYDWYWHVAWRAVDNCSNTAWWNYTIHVISETTPTVSWNPAPPKDGNFTCATPPEAPVPTVNALCGDGTYEFNEVRVNGTCTDRFNLTRTWTIKDSCGNRNYNVTQFLWGVHTVNPTINRPANDTATCESPAALPTVEVHDMCQRPFTPNFFNSTQDYSCPDTFLERREWNYTDECGLSVSTVQWVQHTDNNAPDLTTPTPKNEHNLCYVIYPNATDASVTDECDSAPLQNVSTTIQNVQCYYIFDVVNNFTTTDRCHNFDWETVTNHYSWDKKPEFELPSDWDANPKYPCNDVKEAPIITAKDGCGKNLSVIFKEVRINGTCPNEYTLVRTWNVSDNCSIPNSLVQTVTVEDKSWPTFCNMPEHMNVQCGLVPPVADVTITDNCPGLTVTFNETKVNVTNCCNYELLRTWTATDACGHVEVYTQYITVYDHEPLEFFGIPPDVKCNDEGNCPYEFKAANVTARKAPLARGFCVKDPVTREGTGSSSSQVTLYFGGSPVVYNVVGGTVVTFVDKTAELNLELDSGSSKLNITVAVTEGVNITSLGGYSVTNPMTTAHPDTSNPLFWLFYKKLSGVMVGSAGSRPLSFDSAPVYSQLGVGANGFNQRYGFTLSFKYSDGATAHTASIPIDMNKDGVDGCYFAPDALPKYENCNCSYPVNLTIFRTNDTCEQDYILEARYCAADENSAVYCLSQFIEVCDLAPPTISNLFLNQTTGYCTDPYPAWTLNATDTCDAYPSIGYNDSRRNGTCEWRYTIERRVGAIDACGNVQPLYIEYNFDDTVNPVVTVSPHGANDIFECDNIPTAPTASVTDVCGVDTSMYPTTNLTNTSIPNPGTGATCQFSYRQDYLYEAYDVCSNYDSDSYSRKIQDTKIPAIYNIKENELKQCKATYVVASPTANDTCSGDLTSQIVVTNRTWNSNCPNIYNVTYYFNVKDDCANEAVERTWNISYYDDVAPTFDQNPLPQNTVENCHNVSTAATLTASDTCNYAWVNFTQVRVNGSCDNSYLLIRTWVATDCAGNQAFHQQNVTVVDVTAPVISPRPTTTVAACVPAPTRPSFCASDNCDGVTLDFSEERVQTDPDHQSWTCARYFLNRTVQAVDECGNRDTVNYLVYVNDTVAPNCSANIFSANISCERDAPGDGYTITPPSCSDDCQASTGVNPNVTLFQWSEAGPQNCNGSRIHHYDYYVTDNCGNFVWHNSTINVEDKTAPKLHNVPASQNLQCLADFPVDTTTKSDNCDPNVYINKTVVRTNSSCPNIYNVSITWFPVDECRNVGETNTSLFVYYDDVKPFWTTDPMPQNGTVVCDSVPATPVVAASDDCSGTSFVTVNYRNWTVLDERNCNNSYYLYREWVATDCSGNSIRHVQTLHVIDNVTATISSLPDDKEYFCKSVPPPVAVCASDNCPGVKLSYVSTSTSNASRPTCNDQYVINRTYSAVDNCGNVFTDSYFLVVNDQVAPNCTTNDNKNATCETPTINDPNAPDCGEDCSSVHKYPHHFTDYNGPQNCNSSYIKHFNWLIEDDCGNFVWRNSTVLVYDYTKPTLTNPPSDNNTAECHDVPPTPEVASDDNCREEQVTIAYTNTSSRIDGACQNYDIVRTWVVTDECGNENTYHQIVNVTDTRKPFWTGVFPPNNGNNYTYECSDSFTIPVLTAADLCGNVTVVFTAQNVSFPDQQCQNSYATNWTWVATDKCGNSISYTTFLFVNDTIKPTLSEPEGGNRDVQCTDVPKPPAMCCGDNCNGVHVEYTQTRVNSTKCDYEYQLIRNWTCVDACGNFDTKIQVINVSDHAYPKWISTLPEDEFFECVMGDEQDVLSANDTCSTVNVTQWYTNSSRGCDHNYTVVRYWTAMDECGNLISYNQTVDIRDTQPPWTNTSGLLCYTPEASASSGATDDVIVIPDFTNVNAFFKGADACSSVHIDFDVAYDCTSDQDDLYGVGCVYNATTNTLTISMVRSPDRPQGRLYTITARVVDQCGHQVPTSRQIFVPRDSNSGSYRNFTGDDAVTVATCTVLHSVCPDQCGCQTVDTACAQSTSFGTPLAFFSSYNSVTDTTVLRYTANANNTNRIIIGIDFSEVNLVSWTPDTGVVVGPQVGTYVSGISFQPTAPNCEDALSGCPLIALPEVTITIRGNFATGPARQVPFQVGGEGLGQDTNIYSANNSACSDASGLLNLVAGPSDAAHVTYAGTNDLTGHVYLSGWRDGFDRSLQYGVADVLVALYEAFDGSNNPYVDNIITSTLPTPIAYALTDATGAYVFPRLPKTADKYLVKIQRDALLAATPRSSGHFLTDPVYSQSTYPAYYPADPAKFHGFARLATNPDFKLVFDDENKPEYLRHYASQVFEGNAKVPQYWSYLTQNLRTTYPVDTILLNAYKTYVASKLNVGGCVYLTGNTENFPASNSDAFAPFEIQLKALAYNLASGRGPFEPYRLVAEWTLEYARHIYCNRNTASAQDLALAHNWVKLMNSADDDDRPSPKPVIPSPL